MQKIVIFASGNGSNAENIMKYFSSSIKIEVISVFCNVPNAKVIEKTKRNKIDTFIFSKEELNNGKVLSELKKKSPDLIVLAGFLLKLPDNIVAEYPNRIINIHPSLLPKYGGKGMYGAKVHEAVLNNNEKETGITIHYVNEHYDEGAIIFQTKVNIESCINIDEIAQKIHTLEQENFPNVIESILN